MNTLLTSLLRDLTRHEGLALLAGALLTSAGIVCVAAATATILRHRSARARSLAWRLALCALLIAGAWKLAPDLSPTPVAVVEWQVDWSMLPAAPAVPMVSTPLVLPEPSLWERAADKFDTWAVPVWLGVAALWMAVRVCGVLFGLRALARRAHDAAPRVVESGGRAGLPESACYRVVEHLGSPMLTGWQKLVIWLPAEAETWDETRLQAVLRHEAAHWRRKDWPWQWVAQAAVCLWWWQPLAWLARRQLRMETEHAADDMAVAGSEQAADYARTLVEIAAGLPGRTKAALGVTMLGSDGVKKRVHALMRANRWRGRIGLGALVALALVAVTLSVLVATKVEFSPQKEMYRSVAKLVAGGNHVQDSNWKEQAQDFYGTIIETLESSEMRRRAIARLQALEPKLKTSEVEIRVAQSKGSAIFSVLATGEDPKFTRALLDALLDEFIAFRQSIREQAQGKTVKTLLQETVAKQKAMEDRNAALTLFAQKNNILTNTNGNNFLAQSLNNLQAQREQVRTQLTELKLFFEQSPKENWKPDIMRLSASTPARPLTQMEEVYLKTKSELFVLNNERDFLLKDHKADHPEVTVLDQKIAKAAHLLSSVSGQIREEMAASMSRLENQLTVLTSQIEEQEAAALDTGAKIARHAQLKEEAATAKQAYEKLFSQVQSYMAAFNHQHDYVAIQERASPAAYHTSGSGLLPIWKLWRKEDAPKQASAK